MVLRYKVLYAAILLIFALGWLVQSEAYPFTSMTMFANAISGSEVSYLRVLDGDGNAARPEAAGWLWADGRSQRIIHHCLRSVDATLCQAFARTLIEQLDLTTVEFQWLTTDYRSSAPPILLSTYRFTL